jgi:cytoskeletal protein RodZ
MATPERDTVYTNDANRTVYTRESNGTGWFVGIIVALALLAIGYLVFSANSGPSTSVDVNGAPAVTTTDPAATAPAPLTEAPAAATDAAPLTEAAPAEVAPAVEPAPLAPATAPADAAPAGDAATPVTPAT